MEIDNIKVEILIKEERTKYLGQMVTFQQRRQPVSRIGSGLRGASYKYKQELTSKAYLLRHQLRMFDMVIIPTMSYASGTWTLSKEHEIMIQSAQRKMLRFIIQTKRNYKKKTQDKNGKKVKEEVGKPVTVKDGKEETLTMKPMMETAQTQTSIKTATSPS